MASSNTQKKIICSEIHYEQNIIKFENYPIMINIIVCLLLFLEIHYYFFKKLKVNFYNVYVTDLGNNGSLVLTVGF